ncbi:hypothetical protein MMC34_006822, partial [Xylographa carneopallida]|nr:hypothetical protein [Xylographa carneopallida]
CCRICFYCHPARSKLRFPLPILGVHQGSTSGYRDYCSRPQASCCHTTSDRIRRI